MQELLEDQEIIYTQNDKELTRITRDTVLIDPLAGYVRCYQPFTKAGDNLAIPIVEKGTVRKASVKEVAHEGNVLTITSKQSVFKITYVNIDLEKILEDGQFKGVNADSAAPFPHS